jgi:hypothetical protein
MQQPYEINPECRFQENQPLDENEKRLLRRSSLIIGALALFSFVSAIYQIWFWSGSSVMPTFQDTIMILLSVFLFVFSLRSFVEIWSTSTKEVFESTLTSFMPTGFGRGDISFQDVIGWYSVSRSIWRSSRFNVGARYRIQKVKGRDMILRLERLD